MSRRPVKVVTFDIWDTIVQDDTDESKRAAAGLAPKPVARRELLHAFLERHAPIAREATDLAYDVADAAFNKVWHEQHVTWTIGERLRVILAGLKRDLPEAGFAELVRRHERMELDFRPDPAPGIHEAVKALHGKYPLAIVSDAIVTPGRCLREMLAAEGLLEYFVSFAFSDEIGHAKPSPRVFEHVAREIGCDLSAIVHLGDREHNDIGGPHAAGARGVLITVVKDRGSAQSKADAICRDYAELPAIIDALNG